MINNIFVMFSVLVTLMVIMTQYDWYIDRTSMHTSVENSTISEYFHNKAAYTLNVNVEFIEYYDEEKNEKNETVCGSYEHRNYFDQKININTYCKHESESTFFHEMFHLFDARMNLLNYGHYALHLNIVDYEWEYLFGSRINEEDFCREYGNTDANEDKATMFECMLGFDYVFNKSTIFYEKVDLLQKRLLWYNRAVFEPFLKERCKICKF